MDHIIVYSKDRALFSLLSSAFGSEYVFHCEHGEGGVNREVSEGRRQIVLIDLNSHADGMEEQVDCAYRLVDSEHNVVVLADAAHMQLGEELVRGGAFGVCRCPPSMRELRDLLRRAVQDASVSDLRAPVACSAESFARRINMVGNSESMQHVYRMIQQVADIDASVLITGESGTGKELVARAIHNQGMRSRGPFVAVSCGAIPETLIEAELFGHEKGAFTGTVGDRQGLFEVAGNGTLFLDEIGELSPYTQIKLLRVLQERQFSRLGSNRLLRLGARVIFATHRNLDEMVTLGKFRHDLYFRINIMKIEIPALRHHPEDILKLATHFLNHYSRIFHKPVSGFSAEAISFLEKYHWPGNVREMENVIQQAIIMSQRTEIQCEDLPWNVREPALMNIGESFPGGSFERKLQEFRIKLAMAAVREKGGNKAAAARSLDISRGYLHRLIRLAELDGGDLQQELVSAAPMQSYS